MDSLNKLLYQRRSVRDYEDRVVEREKIEKMIEALLLSPTSKGIRSRSLVLVDNKKLIAELSRCKAHGAGFLESAPLALVISADMEKAAAWIEDCSIAAITLQYSAEELGLSSCWIQIRARQREDGGSASDYIKELLHLPQHFEVEAIVAVGYPSRVPPAHEPEELDWASVRYNEYGKPYYPSTE